MKKAEEITENMFLSNEAKVLLLIYLGHNRFYALNKAGLSSSVIYRATYNLTMQGLLKVNPDKTYELTEKGKQIAEKLLSCL